MAFPATGGIRRREGAVVVDPEPGDLPGPSSFVVLGRRSRA
jgi:hypothetical protein